MSDLPAELSAVLRASAVLVDCIRLGVAAREAQSRYFKTRDRSALVASKVAEKAFDDEARAILTRMDNT